MSEITPKLGLRIPAAGSFTQVSDIQDSFRILDSTVGTVLANTSSVAGVVTSATTSAITDSTISLGINAFAGAVLVVKRNGVLVRADTVLSNTATTLTVAIGALPQAGDTYTVASQANAIPLTERGSALGVATTDVNTELVQLPAGAAAQVASGFGDRVKKADNTWGTAGGAVGGGFDKVFYENDQVITSDYTLTAGKNAMTAGDIVINTGVVVTVPTGAKWTVI